MEENKMTASQQKENTNCIACFHEYETVRGKDNMKDHKCKEWRINRNAHTNRIKHNAHNNILQLDPTTHQRYAYESC